MRDVFGRERHKDFRDDMTGVGALMKPCRTLYVGSLLKSEYADPKALEEALWRNFGEWGEVENINLISRLSIAFVRYRYRSHAEFAFMAMARRPRGDRGRRRPASRGSVAGPSRNGRASSQTNLPWGRPRGPTERSTERRRRTTTSTARRI